MFICFDIFTSYFTPCRCKLLCTCGRYFVSLWAPFGGGVLAVEWVLELNNMAVPLTQEILLFSVILHKLGQCGKLLAAVQVVVVTRVLDLNVGHLIVASGQEKKKKRRKKHGRNLIT